MYSSFVLSAAYVAYVSAAIAAIVEMNVFFNLVLSVIN